MTSDMRTTLVEMVKPGLFVTWSDDATNQNGYKNDACNGPLDKILHIYAF